VDLRELVEELRRQRENSLDIICRDEDIKAIPDKEFGILLRVSDKGAWPLAEWAHRQLAEKLEIPKRYYDRMLESGKLELLSENINAWLGGKRKLIRILDGRIRAILSDRYRIIDNYDLVFLVLDEFRKKETIEIYRIDLTETMLYLKAIDRTLVDSVKDEDIVYGGLIIRNSEVGASALRVEPFILRRICSNGLILQHSLKKIHLGRQTLEVDEIDWSDETRKLEDKTLWAKVRDIIRATFDREVFNTWVKKLKESIDVKIEKPIKEMNNIVRHLNLTEEEREKLLVYFSEPTKYGLINAVTNLAGRAKNVEEQVRLEEFAGKILASRDLEREILEELEDDVR
jgi:hypothetical protein